MQVERCWACLEQPASTTVRLPDGRTFPACDICAAERLANPPDVGRVSDAVWDQIVAEFS